MKILILGDVMGAPGRNVIKNKLSQIISENKIDFTVLNGENSADDGKGITNFIAKDFFYKVLTLLHLEITFGIKKRQLIL